MLIPELKNFSLVGGTALALKFGHRLSVDLDLFSDLTPNISLIKKTLEKEFNKDFIYENSQIDFAVFCTIHNTKVDIVNYSHILLAEIEIIDGIRMYSNKDIAAMKINAILGRGQKKDFFDLAELLKHYSLDEILEWHKQKYSSQQLLISIPSALSYFEDADQSPDPVSLNGQTWESVKKDLQLNVRKYLS